MVRLIACSIAVLWASLWATSLSAQTARERASESYRGMRVRDVRLALRNTELPEATRELIDIAPGDIYSPEAIRRSIRQLFALDKFSDIKVEADRVDNGQEVDVIFHLYPRVEVTGVEVTGIDGESLLLKQLEPLLLEESRIRAGDPLDVELLRTAAERIRSLLREEGFLWAEVEPEASFESPTATVVFHIESGRQARVSALGISGVAPHLEAHIRRELKIGEGSMYSKTELDASVEKIADGWHERGFYRARIEVDATPGEGALVDLHVAAELGPRVHIEVMGGDLSEKTIERLVPLYGETLFTEDLIEESRVNLRDHLVEKGYRDASVEIERESASEDRYLYLRFVVDTGPRYNVVAIELEGLDAALEAEIRPLLATPTNRRFRAAPFQEELWEQDVKVVRSYMERNGYHRVRVEGELRAAPETPSRLTLVAHVDPGPRAVIEAVDININGVEGAAAIEPAEVIRVSGLEPGGPFDATGVVEARDRIVTHYYNEGFRQVDVLSSTTWNETGTTASVEFSVREGKRTRIDRVIVTGLEVTRESSVRQLVALETGDPLSPVSILDTRQQLVSSGLFRSVDIDILPADPITNRSDILISLEEGPRTTFAYGFGFEERQLGRAEFEITRRNLFGRNRTVSVFTRASFRGSRFITTYRQPDSFVQNLPLFVSVYAEEEQRTSFDYNRVGVGLQISKRLSEHQNLLFRYRFDRTKVFNLLVDIDEIDRRFRNVRVASLSAASVTDQRDDPLNPSGGQFRILDLEWSARILGTEAPYLKGLAQQFFYFKLPKSMVLALGLRVGIGQTFREDRDAFLPIAERFWVGGATTLRGFALDEASPKAKIPVDIGGETIVVDGEPIGGNVLTLLNLELRFPIFGNLRGVVFSDNGTVYRRLKLLELLNWRYNVGFGFRFDTPLGPLRVDYGMKLDRRTRYSVTCPDVTTACTESFGRWHISLGHAF